MLSEYSSPLPAHALPVPNLARILFYNAEHYPQRVAVRHRSTQGVWEDRTSTQYLDEVRGVAKGLIARGVKPGDRVVLMSSTRYEWSLTAWAIWLAGAVTVPIYETSSSAQCDWILTDSEATLAIAENDTLRATMTAETSWSGDVLVIDSGDVADLVSAGESVSDEQVEQSSMQASGEDLATLIYTSGTTGRPKGCKIVHAGFGGVVAAVDERLAQAFDDQATTVIFLPLAHVLARIVEITCFYKGVAVCHEPDTSKVVERLSEVHPTFLVSVPRVLEKVYNAAAAKAENAGGLTARIFRAAVATAVEYSTLKQERGSVPLGVRLKRKLFSTLVYGKLHDALGGRCTVIISGGSPLGERLGHFFTGAGFQLLEGYGLTESSGVLTVPAPGTTKIGTVGPPIPGVSLRISDEDGEVIAKATSLFRGYWHNEHADADAWSGDWFHTGDIGTLDADGYLSITGRKKDLIVTAGGKNVSPSQLEDIITSHPLVSQAVVVGDNRHYIAALVTIDPDTFPTWAERHGKTGELTQMLQDGDLVGAVQDAIDRANASVSRAESIRKFRILPGDFSVESGELTPTLKLKRAVIHERFSDDIDKLYTA